MKEWEAAARRQEHAMQEREEEERLARANKDRLVEQLSARVKTLEHECGDLQRERDRLSRLVRTMHLALEKAAKDMNDLQEACSISLQEAESLQGLLAKTEAKRLENWQQCVSLEQSLRDVMDAKDVLAQEIVSLKLVLKKAAGEAEALRQANADLTRRNGSLARDLEMAEPVLQGIESLKAAVREKSELNLRLMADLAAANGQVQKLASGEELAATARSRDNFKEAYESAKEHHREKVGEMLREQDGLIARLNEVKEEVARLKQGRFTEDEFQNLCHGFSEDDCDRFCEGCVKYQVKLFGWGAVRAWHEEVSVLTIIDRCLAEAREDFPLEQVPFCQPPGLTEEEKAKLRAEFQATIGELPKVMMPAGVKTVDVLGVDIVPATEKVLEVVRRQKLEMDGWLSDLIETKGSEISSSGVGKDGGVVHEMSTGPITAEELRSAGIEVREQEVDPVRIASGGEFGSKELSDFSASQAEWVKAKNAAHAVSQAIHPTGDLSFADVDIDTERERDG